MAEKNNQDLYEAENGDDAVINASETAIRNLIAKGKKLGYITMEELNKTLPPEKLPLEYANETHAG